MQLLDTRLRKIFFSSAAGESTKEYAVVVKNGKGE